MNKQIVENYMNDVWNKRDLSVVNNVFSNSAVIHSPLGQFKSPKEMFDVIKQWLDAIPDVQITLLNTLEDNGIVVCHWVANGTHKKDLYGIKAKGNPVAYQGVSTYRLTNGKVVEYWAYLDILTLQDQMKK